ncbi:hypothetical protein BGX28_003772 [Mortierella sp. GBA30]|nr:hypothetical protein BGX28_003772 [Mortierella sp. GBA30]
MYSSYEAADDTSAITATAIFATKATPRTAIITRSKTTCTGSGVSAYGNNSFDGNVDSTMDNGGSGRDDEEHQNEKFDAWEGLYLTACDDYKARLGALQLQLCRDLHHVLVQHQINVQAIETQILQDFAGLSSDLSRTMRSLMGNEFEQRKEKQRSRSTTKIKTITGKILATQFIQTGHPRASPRTDRKRVSGD